MAHSITEFHSAPNVLPYRESWRVTLRQPVLRLVRSYVALVLGLGTALGMTVGVTVSAALGWW